MFGAIFFFFFFILCPSPHLSNLRSANFSGRQSFNRGFSSNRANEGLPIYYCCAVMDSYTPSFPHLLDDPCPVPLIDIAHSLEEIVEDLFECELLNPLFLYIFMPSKSFAEPN